MAKTHTERIEIRATGRQVAAYARAAAREGLSVSAWLRWVADQRAAEILRLRLGHPAGPTP